MRCELGCGMPECSVTIMDVVQIDFKVAKFTFVFIKFLFSTLGLDSNFTIYILKDHTIMHKETLKKKKGLSG